jgi:hypothetical protein
MGVATVGIRQIKSVLFHIRTIYLTHPEISVIYL